MLKLAFAPSRAFLLLGLLAGATLHCLAQDDIDFSVAPSLTPALTDANSNNAPVTTLSVDLLAPQRTFTYDSTGANVFASSLDPTVRADLLAAESETDTAVRDSAQTGQISPYSSGGSRLSTSFSRAGSTADSRNSAPAESSIGSAPGSSGADYEQSYGINSANTMDDASGTATPSGGSSWGATSGSTWGGRLSASARGGGGPAEGAGSSAPLSSGSQSGSSLSSGQTSIASDDLYRSRPVPSIGWRTSGLTVSRATLNATGSAISRGPTSFGRGSTDRFIARPGQAQDSYANPPGSAGSPAGSGVSQQQLFGQGLTFSPFPEASASGSSSPFRSLGNGDFLQPNILGSHKLSLTPGGSSRSSKESRSRYGLQDENNDNPLSTSASDYGLKSALNSSRARSSRGRGGKRTNPYLSGDSLGSGRPSN